MGAPKHMHLNSAQTLPRGQNGSGDGSGAIDGGEAGGPRRLESALKLLGGAPTLSGLLNNPGWVSL